MGNVFQNTTAMIMRDLYPKYCDNQVLSQELCKAHFDSVIRNIRGVNDSDIVCNKKNNTDGVDESAISHKMLSFLCNLIKKLYESRGQTMDSPRRCRSSIENWRNGKNDMIRYTIWTDTSKQSSKKTPIKADEIPSNHVVDFISALNKRYNCFSTPGGSFKDHIKSVSSFLAQLTSRTNTASSVIFYPRSLNDIAFMYCTYMRYTNKDFVDIARRLETANSSTTGGNTENVSNNDSQRRIYYSSESVNRKVVEEIFQYHLCDDEWKKSTHTNCGDDIKERGDKALEVLIEHIEKHRECFYTDAPFGVLGNLIEKLSVENIFYKDIFLSGCDKHGKFLGDLYSDRLLPTYEVAEDDENMQLDEKINNEKLKNYRLKKYYAYHLYDKLRNTVYNLEPEYAEVEMKQLIVKDDGKTELKTKVRYETFETVFGLLSSDGVNAWVTNSISLLRYSMIVNYIHEYSARARNSRPNEAPLYNPTELLKKINDRMNDLGLVALNGIHREKAQVDWCLYKYITDASVRNKMIRRDANGCLK